jgi:hypothetical protein
MRWLRFAGSLLVAMAVVGGMLVLRDKTISRHDQVDPNSAVEVIVQAATRSGERNSTLEELTEALLLSCRLEVDTDPHGELLDLGNDHYSMTFRPSLDSTDRRQFRGCVQDWQLDHVLVQVEQMNEFSLE